MNILVFNWKDIRHPEAGGAEVYTHEICRRLVSRGYSVTLFTSRYSGCKRVEYVDGVRVVRDGGRYGVYLRAKGFYRSHRGFDVVVDEINTRPFMAVDFVEDTSRVVCLIHQLAREYWFYKTPFPVSYVGRFFLEDRWLRKYVDVKTVTVSESTKQDLFDLGFKDVEIVYNGLNVRPLKSVPGKEGVFTVLFVGRLTPTKKPADAVEAFKLAGCGKMWVVGRGEMERELRRRATESVRFFGFVSEKEKYELMRRAHVILVPGVREGWGRVVTEANAMGTPAIGYDVPGLRDSIRDMETGVLCEPDPSCMAEKIKLLKEDENLRIRLSRNALRWSKNFNWDNSTEKFAKILESVAD